MKQDNILMLKNVRLAFANDIWVAKASENEDGTKGVAKFGATVLLPPDHPQIKDINAAMEKVGLAKWADKWPQVKLSMTKQDRMALHDGDIKTYVGFPGNFYISARNATRPRILDKDGSPLVQADGRPYSGCYVHIQIDLWAQDHPKGGKRINAGLRGLMFYKDGDAFAGGGVADEEDFAGLIEGADAGSFA